MQINNRHVRERVLVFDDHPFVGQIIKEILEDAFPIIVDLAAKDRDADQLFSHHHYSTLFFDFEPDQEARLQFIEKILTKKPGLPIIVMTNGSPVEPLISLLRRGVFDVLEKPIHPEKLLFLFRKAKECGLWRMEMVQSHREFRFDENYHGLVGRSPAMQRIFSQIETIRGSDVNVLITGPSGSGKERVARALHDTSPREHKRFVAINCSAIPDTLLEGELFGYKRGAFTDARTDKLGLFQQADGGTLFLDEIGDMPLTVQPKILRAIEEKEMRPLGALDVIKVDARIISATNQNLTERIQNKLFREDLFYRLNTIQLELPALRERRDDIPLLVAYFLENYRKKNTSHPIRGISDRAMNKLIEYSWPGNVRELENIMERSILLARNEWVVPEDLPFETDSAEADGQAISEWAKRRRKLDEVEKSYILEVLRLVEGNRSETAHILGIGRKTLYNKLAKYGL